MNKNRIRDRYRERLEAAERIYISFEYELNKECVLGEEGAPREDFYQFLIGSEHGIGTGGGGKVQIGFLSIVKGIE